MRVLVTGADGFVGRHLCSHLRDQGDSVAEACGPDSQSRGQDPRAVDVTDPVGLRAAVETARPDAIIHLAGFSSVAKSHADPDGPPVATTIAGNASGVFTLPKASVTVLRGKID